MADQSSTNDDGTNVEPSNGEQGAQAVAGQAEPEGGTQTGATLGEAVLAWLDTTQPEQASDDAPTVRRRRAKKVAETKIPTLDVGVEPVDGAEPLPRRRRAKKAVGAPPPAEIEIDLAESNSQLEGETSLVETSSGAGEADAQPVAPDPDAANADALEPEAELAEAEVVEDPAAEAEVAADQVAQPEPDAPRSAPAALFQPLFQPPRGRRAASRPAGPPQASASTSSTPAPSEAEADEPATSGTRARRATRPIEGVAALTFTEPTRPERTRRARRPAGSAESVDAGSAAAVSEPGAATAADEQVTDVQADQAAREQASAPRSPAQRRRRSTASKSTAKSSAVGSEPGSADGRGDAASSQDASDSGDLADPAALADPARPADSAAEGSNGDSPSIDAESGAESNGAEANGAEANGDEANDPDGAEANGADGDGSQDDEPRRRRRRGGRGRRRRSDDEQGEASDGGPDEDATADPTEGDAADTDQASESADDAAEGDGTESSSRRRRRRRRRSSSGADDSAETDEPKSTVRTRQSRRSDEVVGVKGSTRLEAKRQRRREGRETGRRRQIITEAEFLARREAVERTMLVRERDGHTQMVVLEDGVLVEHYVARKSATSLIGNVYLGRVQNVLPSMEAAFVDIGKGRNAVLYAGEVNWDAAGLQSGQQRRIELALKSGDTVLVQVSKDPIGHKGARLTSQVSLPGRYLVYVPGASLTGISRKLPDNERTRLKKILRAIVPEDAGVIVRTAAEGASEDELRRDVERLQAEWADVQKKAKTANAATMLHGEPDLMIKVVRDVFNEDFTRLVISGDDAWKTVKGYVDQVAPDLAERVTQWDGEGDLFAAHRADEQIHKGLDRKVWLPSGGSLVIDRTEAMTVVDVNTGKFVGSGGNLEETVTRNNLEAAEEIVRQLRLRDIGGIVVIDFIDMVLESNRDLVLRRLVECLGRDRTKHQVAEVTSLGLVQMTRKRVGQGLLEAFSEPCEHCDGRGVIVQSSAVEPRPGEAKSGGSKSTDSKASESKSGESKSGQRRNNQAQLVAEAARKAKERDAAKVGDAEAGDLESGDTEAGDTESGGAVTSDAVTGDAVTGEQQAGTAAAEAGADAAVEAAAATDAPAKSKPKQAKGRRRATRSGKIAGDDTSEPVMVEASTDAIDGASV